jgi:hypothetical protein
MRRLLLPIALMLVGSACTGGSGPDTRGSGPSLAPAQTVSAGPTRDVTIDYGTGRIVVPVPLSWMAHRSGHLDLHYVQVYEVFSTKALPPACRTMGPGSTECGVRLNALGAGDAALVVRSGGSLPGSSYRKLRGLPITIGGAPGLDLGTTQCAPGTCRTYALPTAKDRWLELSFAQVAPQRLGEPALASVLRGVRLLHE